MTIDYIVLLTAWIRIERIYRVNSRFDVMFDLQVFGDGHQGLLVDPREAALVESQDLNLEAGVLLDDLVSLLVSVERVHLGYGKDL